jgi:transposase
LHGILQHIDWAAFGRLVDEHKGDHRVRRLSCKDQLIALLFGQLSGAPSLRAIEDGLHSHANRLYHIGARPVARSTLAEANETRPAAVFGGLFAHMCARAQPGKARAVKEAIYLIDSTSIDLSRQFAHWARFSAEQCAAKAHIVYDAVGEKPVHFVVTPARVNDICAARDMPINAGATYVFDLGYYDFGWWRQLHDKRCRIVTRFKVNTPLRSPVTRPMPADPKLEDGAEILGDRVGLLPARLAANRRNPFDGEVREVTVRISTGRILRLLSNDLTADARVIADLYRKRWAIELFFRWVKQTLRITKPIGRSENALRIQIVVALIAYLVIQIAHRTQQAVTQLTAFARLVRSNLMHRKPVNSLRSKPNPPPDDPRQLAFQLT